MQQLAMVENQNCQLREQLDRIKREAQQEALKISEGQMRDLQGKKEEAEEGMGKTMPSMMVCHSVTLPLWHSILVMLYYIKLTGDPLRHLTVCFLGSTLLTRSSIRDLAVVIWSINWGSVVMGCRSKINLQEDFSTVNKISVELKPFISVIRKVLPQGKEVDKWILASDKQMASSCLEF